MLWKIYFWILAIIGLAAGFSSFAEHFDLYTVADALFSLVGLTGLFLYAYKKRFLNALFWQSYLLFMVMWDLTGAFILEPLLYKTHYSATDIVGIVAIGAVLIVPLYIALYRYGYKFMTGKEEVAVNVAPSASTEVVKNSNFLKNIYRSIFDLKSYLVFRQETVARAFLYLLILTLLFGTIGAIKTGLGMQKAFGYLQASFKKDFPDFTFTTEGLEFKEKMPKVTVIRKGKMVNVFDQEETMGADILDDYEKGFYVTKTKVLIKKNHRVKEYDLSPYEAFAPFTKKDVENLFPLSWVVTLAFGFLTLLFFFVVKVFWALVLGLTGMGLNYATKTRESFDELLKLSIYAMTLPIVAETLLTVMGIRIPLMIFLAAYVGIALVYLVIALIRVRKSESQQAGIGA